VDAPGLGPLLRLLAAPFRIGYLQDPATVAALGAAHPACPAPAQERQRWHAQVCAAAEGEGDEELECDAVVIGTGAGGAAAAWELASRGLAVVLVEEGERLDRRDFQAPLGERFARLYRGLGATVALGPNPIPIPVGRSVGGTTTINSGTCLRTPAATLAAWRAEGLAGFGDADMERWFAQVEEAIGVRRADPRHVGEIAAVIAEGARRIGLVQSGPLLRNAVDCDGQGVCQFGCPTDAKQSTNVSLVPRALSAGAFLFSGFRAQTLLREQGRVAGVVATGRDANGGERRLTVRARATVVAMGALLTPVFLRANGVRHPLLGSNLSIHPCGAVLGWFPGRDFRNGRTIGQGFGVFDLKEQGLVFEGGTPPLLGHGLLSPLQAGDFVDAVERYQETAYFAFMLKDSSRGSVGRGLHRDLPLIRYALNDDDFARFRRGIDLLVRMFFAAGAREVTIPGLAGATVLKSVEELEAFWRRRPSRRDFLMTAYHPLGTARIGADPARGVCKPDHEVWRHPGLYVMDGASVPTALGANPQVTIMAMALRAASQLADRLAA
jgi:choline dehydrogenase-like flavoprotein